MELKTCDEFLNKNLYFIKEFQKNINDGKASHFKLYVEARKELTYKTEIPTIEQLQLEITTNTDVLFRNNIKFKIDEFLEIFNEVSKNVNIEENQTFIQVLNFINWFKSVSTITTTPIDKFDSTQPLKNYELFYNRYRRFLTYIEANNIKEFYNTCNDLNKYDMPKVSYEAEKEVKNPNNHTERLIKRFQRETSELIELRKKVYETHKINNVQTKDFNNLLAAFQFTTTGLNEFLNAILPLIESESSTVNKPQQETKTDAPPKKDYNTSQFNESTYNLFCHIVDEYKKDGNIKFINIWYYLKRNIDKTKYKNILFNFTQKTYIEFVKSYGIEIKKFEKAKYKYEDDEVGILQNITDTYYKSLK
ncbi:MAG: hypothetical protein H6587_02430 [Flavobacteriales bacterium]|nr:hypothetical protein [Flavobacteriales bacterium]